MRFRPHPRASGRTSLAPVAALALLAAASPGSAQTTGTLIGRVTDASTGEPLAHVEVVLDPSERSTASSADGRFILAGVPTGLHSLRFELLSYRTTTVEQVEVRAGRRTELDVKLAVRAIAVEPIVVEADRVPLIEAEVAESHHVVPGTELRELPVDATGAAVELTPGVTGGHFRGGRIGQEVYVIDGLPVKNQLEGSSQGLGLEFAPGSLEEIDVTTGGLGAEFGSALSGAVSYVTRRGNARRWELEGGLSTDHWAPDALSRGFTELSISAGGPAGFLGDGSTIFGDILLQGLVDADPRARGLTCLELADARPEVAAEIDALRSDPQTSHLYCPFSADILPYQQGDKLIGFLRLDRPLSRTANLMMSVLRNRFQRQLYTPQFKYNPRYQLGQRLSGTLATVALDWTHDSRGKAYHVTARAGAMRLDRHLGVLDPDAFEARTTVGGFGASDFGFLGEGFVHRPIEEQIGSGRAVPGYIEPGGSTGSPFGPGGEGIFATEGTPGIAAWSRSEMLAADLVAELLSATGHALRGGLSGRFFKVESYERAFAYLPGSIPNYARFYPRTLAGFAEARIATGTVFTATFGLRVESFQSGLAFRPDRTDFLSPVVDTDWKTVVMPRVGLAGAIENTAGATAIRFNFTRVAQPPDFRFFLDTTIGDSLRTDIRRQGNPDLAFERGRAFEIGVSHVVGDLVGVSAVAYRKELTNLVTGGLRFSGIAPGQFTTGDQGTVKGIELLVRGRWRLFELRAGYTLQQATGLTPGTLNQDADTLSRFREFPLAFDRRHAVDLVLLGGAAAGRAESGWGGALAARIQSGPPLDASAGTVVRLPWTASIDLRVGYDVGRPPFCRRCVLRITGDVRNLIGRDNIIALRRDTGGLGPHPSLLTESAAGVPPTAVPIPRESLHYSRLADLDGDGLISADELRRSRVAAIIDRSAPSLFYGEPTVVRLGVSVSF